MPACRLPDRAVVSVAGGEARAFLDRLVTCEMGGLAPGRARFGALLTPQGKIIADFVIQQTAEPPDTFWLDTPASAAPELIKRLSMYRLRAKIEIADRSAELAVVAGWGGTAVPGSALAAAPDPRLEALGFRAVVAAGEGFADDSGPEAYHAHRVALGVPEAGRDLALGDAFPHEAMMDQLAGVDFAKGCYVGQEVVSRMQHRGTARTRVATLVAPDGGELPSHADVKAGEKILGRTGEARGSRVLATIRLDRAADALAAGEPILVEGRPARIEKPGWVRFPFPGEAGLATE